MTDGNVDLTLTACSSCGQTSDTNEQMVGCDSCKGWFHCRCVNATEADLAEPKWFCSADECQRQKKGTTKRSSKTSKKASGHTSDSDKTSVKSDRQVGPHLSRIMQTLQNEQKSKDEELQMERIMREKRIEMDLEFKKKRMAMEKQMRDREMELERELLEQSLAQEKEHLDRMKLMRLQYRSQMDQVQQEIKQLNTTSEADETPKAVDRNPAFLGESSRATFVNADATNVSVRSNLSKFKPLAPSKQGHETDSDDSDETSDSESSEEESAEDESDSEAEKPRTGPSKAQLAARNGITKRLPIFTGKPEEWPLFIGAFEASTEACGFSEVENLVRLQESLKGPALESVRCQLLLPKSVPRVIKKLRQLYGRPEQLLQCHLERIRKLDSPKADKLASYVPFGNTVEQLCDHLKMAGLKEHLVNPLLLQDLVDKLPSGDKREWVRYKKKKKSVTLCTLSKFLSKIVAEACEANVSLEIKPDPRVSVSTKATKGISKGAVFNHSSLEPSNKSDDARRSQKPCIVCQRNDHRLRYCEDFKKLPAADRIKLAQQKKLCKVCLNDHGNAECKFKLRCNVGDCQQRHNPLLHPPQTTLAINAHVRVNGSILFRMLPVMLHCGQKSVSTLAFLDEGASVTLIEQHLADKIGASGVNLPLTINWTSDISRTESDSICTNLWISSPGSNEKNLLKTVQTVRELLLPAQSLESPEMAKRYAFLRDVPFLSYQSERPGLLIGLNNIHVIAPIETKLGGPGEPIAVKSKLGWTVYGPQMGETISEAFVGHHAVSNRAIHDLIKVHYALEESATAVLQESKEDRRARDILERTTKRIGDRFETGLLWRADDIVFPNSFPMALRRLEHLERRLEKTPELYEIVRQQVIEYQNKGYAHRATAEELTKMDRRRMWYLPLNVVLNPKKPGKVRLVWDAAARVDGVSLNSQLLKGPDLLTALPEIVCRFRERPVAFGGDIREMYHQLRIREVDKSAQLFLFRANRTDEPAIYIMDVATFGAASSPCSAQFIKNLNALEFSNDFPSAAEAIIKSHYVDDYFDSVDYVEEAVQRAKDVAYVHAKGGFQIRNWVSNSEEVLHNLGVQKVVTNVRLTQDKNIETERILGIVWNPTEDTFLFSANHRPDLEAFLEGDERPTKRVILSCVMGFFDSQGMFSHFTVHGKLIVQNLWRLGYDWDETVNDDTWADWKRWTALLPCVESVRIPRAYFGSLRSDEIDSLELHVFTDASEHAYGTVAYFRATVNGTYKCALVMSRSKVAPLKRQSIPRLELLAAVLGARLLRTVESSHTLPVHRRFLWTDSQTVLSWIRSDQYKYKQFVAFRIGEIHELTNLADWRWVPSKHNIADVLTKWGQGPPLESNGPWFTGPQFLYQPEENWPIQKLPPANIGEEMRAHLLFHDTASHVEPLIHVQMMSRWTHIVRVTSYVLRFAANCRRKQKGEPIWTTKAVGNHTKLLKSQWSHICWPLQQEEFQKAETVLWKQAQLAGFPDEVCTMKRAQRANLTSAKIERGSLLYKLTPVMDDNGVIRVGGRLEKAEFLPFDTKFPIILPKDDVITSRLVQHYHERFGHANRETVFNEMRQRFYVPKLRSVILKVMNNCIWCRVYRCSSWAK
ncbi:uncharacterized protein LOC134286082 [Aedes albopictus]|uniref:PHD-type domain-containing protein n=1 Tax=Aedes albopictus TaxID=7160 RepID=A0ABM1Z9X5_AEDAL